MIISSVSGAGSRTRARRAGSRASSPAGTSARCRSRRSAGRTARATSLDGARRGRRARSAPVRPRRVADDVALVDRLGELLGLLERASSRRSRHASSTASQHAQEPGHARGGRRSGSRCRRRTAVRRASRNTVIGQPPPPGHRLHRLHVDRVDVGPFLAVDLHVDEQLVHHRGDRRGPRTTRAPSRGTSGTTSSRPTGGSACPRRAPRANASSPHGYQSTGLSACWRRYGLVSSASRFTMRQASVRRSSIACAAWSHDDRSQFTDPAVDAYSAEHSTGPDDGAARPAGRHPRNAPVGRSRCRSATTRRC